MGWIPPPFFGNTKVSCSWSLFNLCWWFVLYQLDLQAVQPVAVGLTRFLYSATVLVSETHFPGNPVMEKTFLNVTRLAIQ